MTYNFSSNSQKKLETCHHDLQLILNEAIKIIDFTIVEGARTLEDQQRYFRTKKSQLDGVTKKSKHQVSKEQPLSLAVDIAPYPINWSDNLSFTYLAGIIKSISHMLLTQDKISHKIRWGGDWNGNNNLHDQTFFDLPHFELKSL